MDMNQVLQQAQQFQQKLAKIQDDLAGQRMSATVGGGMVTATVNGRHELLQLEIGKEVIDPADPVMLQDLVVAAVNEALKKSKEVAQVEMAKLTGGLRIPGLF